MLVERVLPATAAAVERFGDVLDGPWPGEEVAVAGAVLRRRREFATGRWCARGALARLGCAPVALPPSPSRAPRWPGGLTGSITHCAGYRAAAVVRLGEVVGLGIDAEPALPLPPEILPEVATAGDRAHLRALAADRPEVPWDRLLFSAKEAAFKAWHRLGRRWLDFDRVEVRIAAGSGTFRAAALGPLPVGVPSALDGRWCAGLGLIVTAAMCTRSDAAPRPRR